jgi:hypothetical protein
MGLQRSEWISSNGTEEEGTFVLSNLCWCLAQMQISHEAVLWSSEYCTITTRSVFITEELRCARCLYYSSIESNLRVS